MNRETLERMTKEELLELIVRQGETISSLDIQRCNASVVIEHLVSASHEMHNLRYRDTERSHCQDRLDDYVREMYAKYPLYIVSAEYPDKANEEEEREENLTDRSAVAFALTIMREEASIKGDDEHAKTLSRAIELLKEVNGGT